MEESYKSGHWAHWKNGKQNNLLQCSHWIEDHNDLIVLLPALHTELPENGGWICSEALDFVAGSLPNSERGAHLPLPHQVVCGAAWTGIPKYLQTPQRGVLWLLVKEAALHLCKFA